MRNKLFSLMCVLAISLSSWAQTSLKGRVIDEATQTPVVGAKVTLANQNISRRLCSRSRVNHLAGGSIQYDG